MLRSFLYHFGLGAGFLIDLAQVSLLLSLPPSILSMANGWRNSLIHSAKRFPHYLSPIAPSRSISSLATLSVSAPLFVIVRSWGQELISGPLPTTASTNSCLSFPPNPQPLDSSHPHHPPRHHHPRSHYCPPHTRPLCHLSPPPLRLPTPLSLSLLQKTRSQSTLICC